jgi:LmbE family N-acetylglucosaminyl deacetylase
VAFRQALLDMGTDVRLMNVAAHPDDEDGATLAHVRMRHGVKTYAVIATRGEGGQNEIGPELYEELAVIRTREMMAASEVTGAELRFLDLPEFGFSKSPEETFEVWGREETVRRLVRVIREVQPDVIITNHDTETGHGHHRAIALALLEACGAAGRPDRFPEQLEEGLTPGLPSRLLLRVWKPEEAVLQVDINTLDSLRGLTYAEIAAEALRRHRSQGMQGFIDRYVQGEATALYNVFRAYRPNVVPTLLAPGGQEDGPLLRLFDRVSEEDRAISTGTGLALSGLARPDPRRRVSLRRGN